MLTLLITLLFAKAAHGECAADRLAAVETIVKKVVEGMSEATGAFKREKEHFQEAINEARDMGSPISEKAGCAACDTKYPTGSIMGNGWKRQGCKLYVRTKWSLCDPELMETSVGQAVGTCTAEDSKDVDLLIKSEIKNFPESTPVWKRKKADFAAGVGAATAFVAPPTANLKERLDQCEKFSAGFKRKGCKRYIEAKWDVCHAQQPESMVALSNEIATKTGAFLIFGGLFASFWLCRISSKKNFYTMLSDNTNEI